MTHQNLSAHAIPTRVRHRVSLLLAGVVVVSLPALTGAPAIADEATLPAATTVVPASPAASAAVQAVYALGERLLSRGDSGPDVKALQKLLGVKVTGTFNKKTRREVRRIKIAAGLNHNGVVGAKALKAIKKDAKARARAAKRASRGLPRAGSPAESQRYARAYIAQRYGWTEGQMSCLITLWNRESGWRYWVSNPNGVYRGIPQTSSGVWSAMGYTTSQYMSSPEIQIKVGTSYIKGRYGTPCSALSFHNSRHWY